MRGPGTHEDLEPASRNRGAIRLQPPAHTFGSAALTSSRLHPLLGTLVFFLLAPGTVAGLIPWLITRWRFEAPLLGLEPTRWVGAVLIAAGLVVVLEAFARFAIQGLGTPAPAYPTKRLIVSGFYRHVRNPMYVAVIAIIAGQGLLFASGWLIAYAAAVWAGFHAFVVLYEEPTLTRTYGAEFAAYRAAVPRWLPRLEPHPRRS